MSTSKIARGLRFRAQAVGEDKPVGIIVRHRRGVFSAHAAAATGAQVKRRFQLIPATAMEISPSEIEMLSRDETVEYIWPDLPVHTCLDVSVPHVHAPQVWDLGLQGDGVKVGIVDTGLDPTHPDFDGRVAALTSFIGGDGVDDSGHGTHVAGILAGSGDTSGGLYRGVAPGATLWVAKALDAFGAGSMSDVMAGIEWAAEHGVQIINLSLGGAESGDGTDALSVLVDQVVRQLGIVVVAAAGNAGPADSTVGAPGCSRWAITVGAVDDQDGMTAFSSRGPTSDGRVKPDLVFPGEGIVSTQATGTESGDPIAPGYVKMSGTSMAAPHAAGAAALMLEAMPNLNPDQVKRALLSTSVDLGLSPNVQGSGRGDVLLAYEKARSYPPVPVPSQPTEPEQPVTASSISNWFDQILRTLGLR